MPDYMLKCREGFVRFLGESVCIHLLHQLVHKSVSFVVSLPIICFNNLSIGESRVLNISPIIVCGSMCILNFSKVSFMNVGVLAFEAQMFRIEHYLGEYSL